MKAVFKKTETINAVLYILKRLGGSSDIHKVSKILYFADRNHLAKWGRLITGDSYIAMKNGPVPSKVYDVFKYLRGDSYFSYMKDDVRKFLRMVNNKTVESIAEPDMDYLSESDVECLDESIELCRNMGFSELTKFSHGSAWCGTMLDRKISYGDMLREAGQTEGYINYIDDQFRLSYALESLSAQKQ